MALCCTRRKQREQLAFYALAKATSLSKVGHDDDDNDNRGEYTYRPLGRQIRAAGFATFCHPPDSNSQFSSWVLLIACNNSLKFLLDSKCGIYKFSNSQILDK